MRRSQGLDALSVELGFSFDDEEYTQVIKGEELGNEWQGYSIKIFGIIVDRYSEIGIPQEKSRRTQDDIFRLIRLFPFKLYSSLFFA